MEKLVKILKKIWIPEIEDLYRSGLICTERTLQAEIYRRLKEYDKYNIWVEPTLSFIPHTNLDYKKPDLIITQEREIVGIIELKYKPYGATFYREDIDKLVAFSNIPANSKLPLLTIPHTGE